MCCFIENYLLKEGNKILLCSYCIEEIKSRGEKCFIGDLVYSDEESEDNDVSCEWCSEYDDLYEVRLD